MHANCIAGEGFGGTNTNMKRTLLFLALAALTIAGCGKPQTEPTTTTPGPKASGKTLTIAVIPKGTTHEFWKSIHAGAQDAADELGGVHIVWKGPLKEDSKEEQVKIVEDFILKKADGIVLAPLDDMVLRMPVASATKAGIPVVIIDSALKEVETTSFVATDNLRGGQMGGEQMVKAMGGKGKLILLRYQEGSASTDERERGFLDAVKKAKGIEIVSDNQYAGATTETAQRASENLISRFKNPDGSLQVQGIWCPNESSTFGMLRALQDAGLAGKVIFGGFDSSPKLVEALEKGELNSLVLQNPYRMGYLGVKTVVDHIRGNKVEARVDTGEALITKDNMKEPEMAKLLNPKKL